METEQVQFKKEREKTDKSLTLERGKTDDSFHSGRDVTYLKTDEAVSKNRTEADQARLQRRDAADLKRDADVSISIAKDDGSEDLELALSNQRRSEDKAIAVERSNMDAALEYERGAKKELIKMLLIQEREATDKNLMGERAKTDLEAERTAALLTVEQAAHVETKSELTTREEFLAIVSHDLRNPIGSIVLSAEILLDDDSVVEKNDDVKSLIELIQRNAKTSLRLINDILDMERIVDGKIQLQLAKNRIDDLVRETTESFASAVSAKKILLKTTLLNNDKTIMCDKDRVVQILSNIIGNALKFTPAGGSITVEAKQTESEITVSVCDTGPGIAEDQLSRIFERFAQIGNKQRGGLGLGLYISKTLVESHSGKLWVTSVPGVGSTFCFTLPILAEL